MSLEHELRQALKRKEPPRGFDDKVLTKIATDQAVHLRTTTRRWSRASLPIAASLILAFSATYYVQHQQRRTLDAQAQTEQAARDVVLALQIASDTISTAQAKVEEITRYEPTNDH